MDERLSNDEATKRLLAKTGYKSCPQRVSSARSLIRKGKLKTALLLISEMKNITDRPEIPPIAYTLAQAL
jgi:hypothetical protein